VDILNKTGGALTAVPEPAAGCSVLAEMITGAQR